MCYVLSQVDLFWLVLRYQHRRSVPGTVLRVLSMEVLHTYNKSKLKNLQIFGNDCSNTCNLLMESLYLQRPYRGGSRNYSRGGGVQCQVRRNFQTMRGD